MSQPEPAWLFELFQQDMDRLARWFRRQFFYALSLVIITGFAAAQQLLNFFLGDPFILSFLLYGMCTAACLLWLGNAKGSFGKWREYRHYIK